MFLPIGNFFDLTGVDLTEDKRQLWSESKVNRGF